MSTSSTGVVHVIAATLRADADESLVDTALERARALNTAPGARRVVLARSEQALLAAIWLDDRAALEPFAASPEHMAFVMRGLAPCIAGMWSAAVEAAAPPPSKDEPFEALWVFAVRTSDTAFEWQVRDVLHSLDPLPATVAAGPTFEERDRYRAGGVACIPAGGSEAFRAGLDAARGAWCDMAADIVESVAPVVQ
jgi:hypothetical protein